MSRSNFVSIKILILFIAIVCGLSASGQNLSKTQEIKLKHQLITAEDKTKLKIIQQLTIYYTSALDKRIANLNEALRLNAQGLSLARKLHDANGIAKTYINLAVIYRKLGQDNKNNWALRQAGKFLLPNDSSELAADIYYENAKVIPTSSPENVAQKKVLNAKALKIFNRISPNSLQQADTYVELGALNNTLGDQIQAIKELEKALQIYDKIGFPNLQKPYLYLTGAYANAGLIKKSFQANLKTLHYAELTKDSLALFSSYTSLQEFYGKTRETSKQIACLRKAKALAVAIGSTNMMNWVNVTLASVYNNAGQFELAIKLLKDGLLKGKISDHDPMYEAHYFKLVEAYTGAHQYQKAAVLFPRMMAVIKNKPAKYQVVRQTLFVAVKFLIGSHQYKDAAVQLNILSRSIGDDYNMEDDATLAQSAFLLDSAQHQDYKALVHFQRFKALRDSLDRESYDKELSQLKVQYESHLKDRDIESKERNIVVLTRQTELQKEMIRNQQSSGVLLFGAIVLLIALLVISLSSFHLKKKSNMQLITKQKEIKTQNYSLRQLINEREWLLKEIHHRVKNNLQIVISLLRSQSTYQSDSSTNSVLRESQNRLHAISLIHQKFYQADNLAEIDMKNYIIELVSGLKNSFKGFSKSIIDLKLEMVKLDIEKAIPIGMIINEAITDILNYAFNKETEVGIFVQMENIGDGGFRITVEDTSSDQLTALQISEDPAPGTNLITELAQQLNATLTMSSSSKIKMVLTGRFER